MVGGKRSHPLLVLALLAGCGGATTEWETHRAGITGSGSMASRDDAFVGVVRVQTNEIDDNQYEKVCTGSLIRGDAVLAPASCLIYFGKVRPAKAIKFYLFGGNPTVQELKARKVVVHPGYNLMGTDTKNDLGIILLESPAQGITPGRLTAKGTI